MEYEIFQHYQTLLFDVAHQNNLESYAIVDTLRDNEVQEEMVFSNLEYLDLWDKRLTRNEQDVPLYLVKLERHSHLVEYLLESHSKGLATYFMSAYSLEELRAYYSKFTFPKIEAKRGEFTRGILGFYDAHVLTNYISTLYNSEKIEEFFAPSPLWFVPDLKDENLLSLHYINAQEILNSLPITMSREGIKSLEELYISKREVELIAKDRVIDFTQVEEFNLLEREKFVDAVFEEFEEEGFGFMVDAEKWKALTLTTLLDEAKSLGLESEAGAYHYILLCCLSGGSLRKSRVVEEMLTFDAELDRLILLEKQIERRG